MGTVRDFPLVANTLPRLINSIAVSTASGMLVLDDVCTQGGPRLLVPTVGTLIKSVQPDPVSGIAHVLYNVGERGRTKLTLHTATGQESTVLVDAERDPGEYEATIEANTLPSGVYFLRLRTGTLSTVKAVLVVK